MASVHNLFTRAARFSYLIKKAQTKRIRQLKEKYPELSDAIDLFVKRDPSGNYRYLQWAIKQALRNEPINEIPSLIEAFHKNLQRMKVKDINSYKTLGELRGELEQVLSKETRSQNKAKMYEQADVIYNDDQFLVVHPRTTKASQFFGKNTKWCTAATQSDNYFFDYSKDNKFLFYVIDKKGNEKFALLSAKNPNDTLTAFDFKYFDEEDKEFQPDHHYVNLFFDGKRDSIISKINEFIEKSDYKTFVHTKWLEVTESIFALAKPGYNNRFNIRRDKEIDPEKAKQVIDSIFNMSAEMEEEEILIPILFYLPKFLSKDQISILLNSSNSDVFFETKHNIDNLSINNEEKFDIITKLDWERRSSIYDNLFSFNQELVRKLFDFEFEYGKGDFELSSFSSVIHKLGKEQLDKIFSRESLFARFFRVNDFKNYSPETRFILIQQALKHPNFENYLMYVIDELLIYHDLEYEMLEYIAVNTNVESILYRVANSKNVLPNTLKYIYEKDSTPLIQYAIATNPNTPLNILEELAGIPELKDTVVKNPTYQSVRKLKRDDPNTYFYEEDADIPLSINEPEENYGSEK